MVKLCGFCNKRNDSEFPECKDSYCFICKGASAKLEEMIAKAANLIPLEWKSFSISTVIPRKMMAAEESVWDFKLGRSIKDDFNKRIVSDLVKKTNLDYDVLKSDGKLIFDFEKNEVRIENSDIFIFGRYKKEKAGVAQSEWICRKCSGKGCETCDFLGKRDSIEETLSEAALKLFNAKKADLHASGREDIDVQNFAGRPFILEIRKPKKPKITIKEVEKEVNSNNTGVLVQDLKYVSNSKVALVSDSHFDKAYEAEVQIQNPSDSDIEKILKLKGTVLNQHTPIRVKHRRADLIRKRKILDIKVLKHSPLTIYILAEAGTYIKELISGDEGRTKPSISSVLNKEAKCIKLSVKEIYDDFLREMMGEDD